MKKPDFEKFSLFQLMVFCEENNYNEDYCSIVDDLPEWNPFETKPDYFEGTAEEWWAELDRFEDIVRAEYLEICEKLYEAKEKNNKG